MKAFPRQASAVFVLVWVGSGVFCTSWALAKEPVIATASTNPTRPKLALFVTNLYSSEPVQAYPLGSSGDNAPLSSVPESSITGLSKPEGIARDSKGYLYVTNEWGHSVTVYAAGANGKVAPISSIEVNSDPTGIALDSKGAIYVTNWIGDSIEVFAAVPLSSGTPAPRNAVSAAEPNVAGVRSEELIIGRVIASATKFWTTAAIGGDATELNGPRAIALDSGGNIYVANGGNRTGTYSVTIYRAGSTGNTKPSAVISGPHTGLLSPCGIALDSRGDIYVANLASSDGKVDSITIYPPGSNGDVAPKAIISGPHTGLDSPGGLAVDSHGDIYVTNAGTYSGGRDTITVYAHGSNGDATPRALLPALGLAQPCGITVDSEGNLYVANDGSSLLSVDSVLVYPPNSLVPKASIGSEPALRIPNGITIDDRGMIYVTNSAGGGDNDDAGEGLDSINVYAPGSYAQVVPNAAIIGKKTGLAQPFGIANSKGKLYVANAGGGTNGKGSVTIYPTSGKGNIEPLATIYDEGGFKSPSGIALDSNGNLYVVNTDGGADGDGSITIYRAGATGNVGATATISGDKTGLANPVGIALDLSGKIYVVNSLGENEITIYPPLGSTAGILNEAPAAAIHGTIVHNDKGIYTPSGIILDSAGNIYVTYGGWSRYPVAGSNTNSWGSIAVYPAHSSGNVKPIAILDGELSSPQGMAIGPAVP